MRQPLPKPPERYDVRDQTEVRRLLELMLVQVQAELEDLRREIIALKAGA